MSTFRLRPQSSTQHLAHPPLSDEKDVIDLISRLNTDKVDVERDGAYAFTVQVTRPGVWKIYNRA